jgi:hypothetical protein
MHTLLKVIDGKPALPMEIKRRLTEAGHDPEIANDDTFWKLWRIGMIGTQATPRTCEAGMVITEKGREKLAKIEAAS